MRFFIYLAYNGAGYHGWQNQPNGITIQEEIERALSTILRQPTSITGAGRTDAGVHAKLMVAHFDYAPQLQEGESWPVEQARQWGEQLAFKLNGFLPDAISIYKIVPVRADAHARFDATSRRYEYWVTTAKNPYAAGLLTPTHFQLDYPLMNQAAALLLEETDFASFCKAHTDVKTTICDVRKAYWEQRPSPFMPNEQCWVFTIEADRFLRNMVRAVVGTLYQVGRHLMTPAEMQHVIHSKSRNAAGMSMPADGLYLVDITYPESIFL